MKNFMYRILREEGGEGGAGTDVQDPPATNEFIESLAEENRTDSIKKFESADALAKSYTELEGKIGAKGVILPTENSTPEDKEAFYNALGRPESPEGYKLDPVEGLHESVKVTPESTAAFSQVAHKFGFTQEQANGLNQWYMGAVSQAVANQEKADQEAMQAAETALRSEWGDKYEANLKNATGLVEKAGGKEAIDAMGGAEGLGNNPVILKLFANIAGMLSEDQLATLKTPGTPAPTGHESKEEALRRIKEEFMNSEHDNFKALYDDRNPKHDEAVKEKDRLYAIAYGEGA